MGYPLDLDEYDEQRLAGELELRQGRRSQGLCDYCGREPDTNPCKFPERHRGALAIREQDMAALAEVGEELKRARAKFPAMHSGHEGWAAIKEELDELWDHIRSWKGEAYGAEARKEAIQVAAMGVRFASDICPIDQDNDEQS